MDSKVCVASLLLLVYFSTAQGAMIPSEVSRVFQKVQDVLVNADTFAPALAMRVKRDTGDWDKELDMEALGLSFKIKYVDPSNPFLGGHAYLKFPGHRFVKAANFDDVELKLDFQGSIGQFNMKIEYKFIQKFRLFADQPQNGVIRVVTNLGSKSNLEISLERNGTKEFEIKADGEINDGGIKLDGQVSFEHNNIWEMFINLDVSSRSVNIRFIQNDLEYSVAANAFSAFKSHVFLPSHLLKVDIQIAYPGHRHSFQVEYSLFYETNIFMVKIAGDFHGPFGFQANLSQDSNLKMSLERNGTKQFEINGEINDGGIKLHGQVSFEHNNVWEMFIYLNVSSRSVNIRFIQNGLEYSVTANAFSAFKWLWLIPSLLLKVDIQIAYPGHRHSFQVEYSFFYEPNYFMVNIAGDFHGPFGFQANLGLDRKSENLVGKLWLYIGDKKYALIDLVRDVRKVKYNSVSKEAPLWSATYSFMDGWPQFKTEGKANIHYDTDSLKKLLTIHYTELNGKKGNINIEIEPQNTGFKYLMNITHDGKKILKQESVLNILDREVTHVVKTEADESSPFYKLHCYYIYPVPCTTSIQTTRKYSNHRPAHFTYEEDTLHGLEKFSSFKMDMVSSPVGWEWANTTYTYKQGGKIFREGQHDFQINKTMQSLKFKTYSKIFLDENSFIYAKLCGEDYPINCSNVYEFEKRFYIDSRNKTMDLHLEGKKDGDNFHLFKWVAMNNLGKLELNGNEICDYKISGNQLTATYQLPGGEKTNVQLVKVHSRLSKNQGSLKIETPASQFILDVDYDVTHVKNGQLMMHVHGENLKFGKYEFLRKAGWNVSDANVVIEWDGKVQFEKGPLAIYSPIDTKAHVDYEVTNMVLTANIEKDIAGKTWSFQVTNDKVSLNSQ